MTWLLLYLTTIGHAPQGRQLISTLARAFGDVDADTDRELAGVSPWIPQVTSLVVSATLLGAVVVFLRSATRGTVWSVDREIQLRRLLQLHGHLRLSQLLRDPPRQVGRCSLRTGMAGDHLPGGTAECALASGDPVGVTRGRGRPRSRPGKAEAAYYG